MPSSPGSGGGRKMTSRRPRYGCRRHSGHGCRHRCESRCRRRCRPHPTEPRPRRQDVCKPPNREAGEPAHRGGGAGAKARTGAGDERRSERFAESGSGVFDSAAALVPVSVGCGCFGRLVGHGNFGERWRLVETRDNS